MEETTDADRQLHRKKLLEELDWLQRRLADMGYDGDCAYERALVAVYDSLVSEKTAELRSSENG